MGDRHPWLHDRFFCVYRNGEIEHWSSEKTIKSKRDGTRKWVSKNQDHIAKYKAEYRSKNADKIREYSRSYHEEHKEERCAKAREYRRRNPKAAKETQQRSNRKHRDKRRALGIKWRKNNPERHAFLQKRWNAENRDLRSEYTRRRDAMKREQTLPMSSSENESIIRMYSESNLLSTLTGIKWQVDHTKPISKGGLHHPSNMQVVPASWNASKRNFHSERWNGNLPALDFDWGALMNGTE